MQNRQRTTDNPSAAIPELAGCRSSVFHLIFRPSGPAPDGRPDLFGKAVQLLHDGIRAGPGKVEDQMADAQALVRPDILHDLLR